MFISGELIRTVDTHTAGEGTRIIHGGLPRLTGSMNDKLQRLRTDSDHLRTVALCEPRGHAEMFGAFLLEPGDPECDAGVVFADATGYHGMCGHGTIGVITAGVQLGLLPARESIALDTPAGRIDCAVELDGQRVRSVALRGAPSFVHTPGLTVPTRDYGSVRVDVVYGGNFFGIVDAAELGLDVCPANTGELVRVGLEIRDRVNERVRVEHPLNTAATSVEMVEIGRRVDVAHYRNIVVLADGKFDRSPCGTGTAAKMALLDLPVGAHFTHDSVIGSTFTGVVEDKGRVGQWPTTVSRVSGSAWVTGFHQFIVDDTDPFPSGFTVG